jgi:hypothetical protein
MCHSVDDLPRSDCTCSRHKENKYTSPIIYWTSKLILMSLIEEINGDVYYQKRVIRVANKVAKILIKIARD